MAKSGKEFCELTLVKAFATFEPCGTLIHRGRGCTVGIGRSELHESEDVNRRPRMHLLLAALMAMTPQLLSQAHSGHASRTFLLWNVAASRSDSLDQRAFEITLESMGFHPERVAQPSICTLPLDSSTLLVAPRAAANACTPVEVSFILGHLLRGLSLIADGESPLRRALGIRLGSAVSVSRILDRLRPDVSPYWSGSPKVPWVSGAPRHATEVLYVDRGTGHPLAILLQRGRGRCLYLAPLFDPRVGRGYGRFATLPDAIVKGLGRTPQFSRRGADAYFDAGFRGDRPPDSLASNWRRWGITAVHAAAWYTYDTPNYDYHTLIDACHRNGILVYAWLEWPYVGKGFWNEHPEWRQKNALLQDAHFDFLYLMDLRNPACFNKALEGLDSLLTLDWDGVDVAEFTLTGAGKHGLQGPSRPDWFTGFTDYCRAEFSRRQGYDPLEFFNRRSPHFWKNDTAGLDSFYQYRIEVNLLTQHRLFSELDRIRRQQNRGWELILTIVDNSLHPEFNDLLGFDMNRTLDLLKEFDVTLQVEDPYLEWTKPPERYAATGEYYRRLLGDRPFVIDVNVVPMKQDRKKNFSTWQPVGTEVMQFWQYATARTDRVCFYCESSVAEKDWELLPFAIAANARASADSTGWWVETPTTVTFQDIRGNEGLLLDDNPWYGFEGNDVIIPPGRHRLRRTGLKEESRGMRLQSITGELLNTRSGGNMCTVEYESRPRCILSFSRHPVHISIDGIDTPLPVLSRDEASTIVAPPGRHTVVVSGE